MMQVILLDDVIGLGEAGDIVKVKDGFGRNFLIPEGLAQYATREGMNRIEAIRKAGEARRLKRISEVKDKVVALDGKSITVAMKAGAETKIFGAVTPLLLSERIKKDFGLDVDRRYIMLEEPIKHLGTYQIVLKAGNAASATINLSVIDESTLTPAKPKADRRAEREPITNPEPIEEAAPVSEEAEEAKEEMGSQIEERLSQ
jgi:large subunit ribosomal protein L9